MAITDQNLYNEIQGTLMETQDNGATYSSGLYTVAEVVARLNYRLDLFNKLSNIQTTVSYTNNALTDARKAQDYSTQASNVIDILSVFYTSDNGTTWYAIPRGSSFEADVMLTTQAATTLPLLWTLDTAQVQNINFFPPPSFSSGQGKLGLMYVPKIGTMPTTPDGTTISMPDDFTPFVKYGVLADLFMKSGESYDPVRGEICESLFQLGIEAARGWISSEDVV